jgi:hypothetical protein
MESLTVPARSLPAGCRLRPLIRADGRPFVAYPGVRENPWRGSGRIAAIIAEFVNGPRLKSDETSRLDRLVRLESEVSEAYRAVYVAADDSEVNVYAVRFKDPKYAIPASLSRLSDRSGRVIVHGTTAVWLLPSRDERCLRAVTEHIASIVQPAHDSN